jgi:hypothetical protein
MSKKCKRNGEVYNYLHTSLKRQTIVRLFLYRMRPFLILFRNASWMVRRQVGYLSEHGWMPRVFWAMLSRVGRCLAMDKFLIYYCYISVQILTVSKLILIWPSPAGLCLHSWRRIRRRRRRRRENKQEINIVNSLNVTIYKRYYILDGKERVFLFTYIYIYVHIYSRIIHTTHEVFQNGR